MSVLQLLSWTRVVAPLGLCAVTGVLHVGCIEPFETPAEYDSQRFLCSEANEEAYAQAVAGCANDAGCGGIVSFQGKLEGVPVTVESTQTSTVFRRVSVTATDEVQLDRVDTYGASPYFEFGLQIESVGGSADDVIADAREMTVDSRATRLSDHRTDNLVTFDMRLNAGGESVTLFGLTGGSLLISKQSPEEMSGAFVTSFGKAADRVEGCFTIFPTSLNTSEE